MADKHPLRNGIISSAVGTLLAAAALALTGKLGVALGWLWGIFQEVWSAAFKEVPVPTWALLVLVLVMLFLLVRLRLVASSRPTVPAVASTTDDGRAPEFGSGSTQLQLPRADSLEAAVLTRLLQADGAAVNVMDLHYSTGAPRLRVEQAIERLIESGFLVVHRNIVDGRRIGLTRDGRDRLLGV